MSESNTNTPSALNLPEGRRIAYHQLEGKSPGVVFLGGFRSDMTGSKAMRLEHWAQKNGRAFLRFDYTGHGASSGNFEYGTIGDWAQDAWDAIIHLTSGPQIFVGSSMGGWIMLLLARRLQEQNNADRLAGLVGVAAAPDFTEDLMKPNFSESERMALAHTGRIVQPSAYDEEPTVITQRLLDDGANNLVLRSPLAIDAPVRLLHGSADPDVPLSVGLCLLDWIDCSDARMIIIKDAGHRLSEPTALELLEKTVADL